MLSKLKCFFFGPGIGLLIIRLIEASLETAEGIITRRFLSKYIKINLLELFLGYVSDMINI